MSGWVWIFKFESWLCKSAPARFIIPPHDVRAQWTCSNSPTLSRTKAALWLFHRVVARGRNPGIPGSRDPGIEAVSGLFGIPGLGVRDPGIRIFLKFYQNSSDKRFLAFFSLLKIMSSIISSGRPAFRLKILDTPSFYHDTRQLSLNDQSNPICLWEVPASLSKPWLVDYGTFMSVPSPLSEKRE